MGIQKPCLNCRRLIEVKLIRCAECNAQYQRLHPKPERPHYKGNYRKRAKQIRDTAITCWICGKGTNPKDPWTADHLIAGDPNSPLAAAHRSCNSRRGNNLINLNNPKPK